MNKPARIVPVLTLLLACASSLPALNLGLHGGLINNPGKITYGLTLETGLLIPFCKLEFEAGKRIDADEKFISGAVVFSPRLRTIRPYVGIGVATEFLRLDLHFNRYEAYSFLTGGAHLFFNEILSLRFDLRWQNYGEYRRTRVSSGLFVHL